MGYKYSATGFSKDHMARAVGVALPVSRKQGIEISNALRNKPVADAKRMLENVIAKREAVPFRRFNRDMGHKPGMAMGRYPVKASSEIKRLLESAESNAQFKGLNTSGLIISHMSVQQAPAAWRHGRQRRRQMKRATIEIILKESKKQEKSVKKTATPKKQAQPKAETKQAPVKQETKSTQTEEKKSVQQGGKKEETQKPADPAKTEEKQVPAPKEAASKAETKNEGQSK